jgi:nucleolar protein 15
VKKEKTTATTANRMVRRFNKLRLKAETKDSRGIVYVGHLPKGFNEEELKKFFGQFGTVDKMRVSRSKKTGRSKGYAFLEFEDKEVAKIAVGAMDKYLMFGKQI